MNTIPSRRSVLVPALTLLLLVTLLQLHAQRAEVKPGPPRSESTPPTKRERSEASPKREVMELERRLDGLREKLDAQRAAGNDAAAAAVKEDLVRVERELDRARARLKEESIDRDREPAPRPRGGPPGEPGRRDRPWQEPLPPDEVNRRLHHLEIAIENLHAAGLHEPAERLAQQAGRMRSRLQGQPQPEAWRPAGPGRPNEPDRPRRDEPREHPAQEGRPREGGPGEGRSGPDAMAPLRQEIRRLHEEIQALHRRMDELSR